MKHVNSRHLALSQRIVKNAPYSHLNKFFRKQARKYYRFCCGQYARKKYDLYTRFPMDFSLPKPIEKTEVGFRVHGFLYYNSQCIEHGWMYYCDGKPLAFLSEDVRNLFTGEYKVLSAKEVPSNCYGFFRDNDWPISNAWCKEFDVFFFYLYRDGLSNAETFLPPVSSLSYIDVYSRVCDIRNQSFSKKVKRWEAAREIERERQNAEGSARQLRALGFVA